MKSFRRITWDEGRRNPASIVSVPAWHYMDRRDARFQRRLEAERDARIKRALAMRRALLKERF